jgi:3-oxoacyl-[acyl-carrier protein] reductase
MKIDLTNKNAVITGATGELGRTMVRSLAKCGANIGLCYYNAKDFSLQLKNEIEKDYDVKAVTAQVDVTDLNSVFAMKKVMGENLGVVDIIVNNAVIQLAEWKTIIDQSPEDYESQFKSSVMQNVYMAKAFVPDMQKQNYGRVIGINTECTIQCFNTQSAYVSGKRGMDGVMRVLAREAAPYNITVNQIAPGWITSDEYRDHNGSESNINQEFPYIDRVPMGRRGTDTDTANAVCFLASDLAGFITGAFLPVSGGNVMTSV